MVEQFTRFAEDVIDSTAEFLERSNTRPYNGLVSLMCLILTDLH